MEFGPPDIVVLRRDADEHGRKAGDTATVVELHEPDGVEIELLTGTRETRAVLTLSAFDVGHPSPNDMPAVRSVDATADRWPRAV